MQTCKTVSSLGVDRLQNTDKNGNIMTSNMDGTYLLKERSQHKMQATKGQMTP